MLKRNVLIILLSITLVVTVVLTLIAFGKCCFRNGCEIPLQTDDDTPVFVNLQKGEFVYALDGEAIVIAKDESITIGCPGSKLNIGVVHVEITCISETYFLLSDDNVDVTSFYCEDPIKSTARYTGNSCESNGREIEVGFDFGQNKFIRQMRICFDEKEQNTYYSEHRLTSLVNNKELLAKRPYFDEAGFYNLNGQNLFKLYNRRTQRETINKQLNIALNSTKVIKDGDSYYLSRGHLAPKADFYYAIQQIASFYYVNSAPQWGIINSKSWNILEWRIRAFVTKRGRDLQVLTGTYGDLTLSDYSQISLYLYYNPSARGIPIPEIFWKIVFDPNSKLGVAFVGTNNPFLKRESLRLYCNNILDKLEWIKINNNNMTQGFIYACDVVELSSRISSIPNLNIGGLLIS